MNETNIVLNNKNIGVDVQMVNENKIEKIKYIAYLFIKRLIDIIAAIVGIIFLIPLTIIVKIAYMLSGDFDSIFYNFERVGKDGKLFKLYKYRTMIPNADEELKKILKKNKKLAKEYAKYKKMENDPRVTKVGKVLRATSLDEFPQFLNILFGQMTLVAPRPYLEREKEDMGEYFDTIVSIKPGLTGYWQVNGRSNTDFDERLVMDVEYIKIRNLVLDIKIIFLTFLKVIKKDGAK